MDFIVKKTTECRQDELKQINQLYNDIFDKKVSLDFMLNQYTQNPFGYSYHSLIYDDETIVGMNVYVPVYFRKDGEKVLMANSIDSMVSKPYRDYFNYHDMVQAAYKYMKKEGVKFVCGYPNDKAYPVVVKSKLMKEIGKMYTYTLPYRIGGIKKSLSFLNFLSEGFCLCWAFTCSLLASKKVVAFKYDKDLDSYNATRYKRDDGQYTIKEGFVYKIMDYDGIRAVFLVDVFEKSPYQFCKAVKYILKHEGSKFDILLYPGYLPFSLTGMIKIPHKFEPKHFYYTGKLLDKSFAGDDIWDITNWDTNLSNYDLL